MMCRHRWRWAELTLCDMWLSCLSCLTFLPCLLAFQSCLPAFLSLVCMVAVPCLPAWLFCLIDYPFCCSPTIPGRVPVLPCFACMPHLSCMPPCHVHLPLLPALLVSKPCPALPVFCLNHPDQLQGPLNLLFSWYSGNVPVP